MPSQVKVKKTSSKTADIINPILIDETSITRRLLIATIVNNEKDPDACISATIVHQRKGKNDQWEDVEAINLQKLKAGEGVRLHFGCTQLKKLREAIEKAYTCGYKGVLPTGQYIFGKEDEFIIPVGKEGKYIQSLLERNYGENIWEQLVELDPDLATKLSMAKIQSDRIAVVKEFITRITNDETEKFWQQFLSQNDWIFGFCLSYIFTTMVDREVYVGGTNINGRNGELCDFMAMSEGNAKFTSLVEIKRPTTPLLSSRPTRGTTYGVSKELSDAVAQLQTYCYTWGTNSSREAYSFQVRNNSVPVLPKGILVIGNTSELDNEDKIRSFELFRRNLNNPEIITYDELLARARYAVKYDDSIKEVPSEYIFDINDLPF
ncbi:MAG: DUF4263 domain-containing protein [Alistipes sp.]|nr:DUF4263 domain-containing protein [Alistipes sp.]